MDSVLGLLGATHQLEIVDDDHIKSMFGFEATALSPHLHGGGVAGIVDVNWHGVKSFASIGEAQILLLRKALVGFEDSH